MEIIKICGMNDLNAVDIAGKFGATHLGFIFYEKSPRYISPPMAGKFSTINCKRVAVCVEANDELLADIFLNLRPHFFQLHGIESVERVNEISKKYDRKIIKAISVAGKQDLELLAKYSKLDSVGFILLDTKCDSVGGSGASFDWQLVENLQCAKPLILAGGIGINNVDKARQLVNNKNNSFCGIDLSSSLESTAGVKDAKLIEKFLLKAKNATNTTD